MKITDKDGKEIEVMNPEEVQAKLDEVVKKAADEKKELEATYQTKFSEFENKLSTLETEKKSLEDKISGNSGDDHPNFKVLKEALDKKEAEIKTLIDSVNGLHNQRIQDYLGSEIKKAAKGDVEVEKKIKFHFEETLKAMPNKTQEEIIARIEAAKTLSGVNSGPSPLDGIGGGGHFDVGAGGGNGLELSSKEKEFGKKFGLSDEDYKKYGPKLRNNYGK